MQRKDLKEVYRLQHSLINNFGCCALAIRKVVTNKGGKTPGVDEVVWKDPSEYFQAAKDLKKIVQKPDEYRAKPLLRVMIPKGDKGDMCPLGIPTVMDRAVQAIYHFAVDPAVEVTSDRFSFGFRKHRSTHDAIIAIRSCLDKDKHPR
jgi:RNA-directed DNA polymerase